MITACVVVAKKVLEQKATAGLYLDGEAQRNYYQSECGRALSFSLGGEQQVRQLINQSFTTPVDSVKERLTIYGDLSLAAHLAESMNSRAIWLEQHCESDGTLIPPYLKKNQS